MSSTYDAIVVGGGIVGCACAYYLSQDLRRVLVVEEGPIGGGTTAAGMGHVVVMDDSDAQFALTQYSQELWNGLYALMPASAEVERCGTLWVAADEEEASHLPAKQAAYAERGIATEVLDSQGVARAEPHLREGLAGGLRVVSDSVIFPMTAAQWLFDQAAGRGTTRIFGSATAIGDGEVRLSDGISLRANVVVNAAGSRASDLTPGLPIQPRKGHLVITDRYPGMVRHQLVEMGYLKSAHSMEVSSVAFNVQPRATGQLLIGSSRQFVGWDPAIDREMVARMMVRALEYMPDLARTRAIRTWIGFRAATPDKLPLIGQWAGDESLFMAAGHEGLGITTSVGTGKLIADLVAGREPGLQAELYSPNRGVDHAH